MTAKYKIRTMTQVEVGKICVEWAAKEGWNPGLHDLESFYSIDNSGFFVGLLNDKPISCISAVSYNKDFGFIGFYIFKQEERGKGYGYKLWQGAMKHFTTENIGLDGVVAQQDNYKKSGFNLAYRHIRFQGISRKYSSRSLNVTDYDKSLLPRISEYDLQVFPTPREKFLQNWFDQDESSRKVFFRNNRIQGYGMIRKCRNGYKIGPLFADNIDIASEILESLLNSIPNKSTFYLDVPEPNMAGLELVQTNKLKYVFETARMYTKSPPIIDLNKQFGITTFEVG